MIERDVIERVREHAIYVNRWCEANGFVRLATYCIGSWNYGLGEDDSDVDTRSIVVPNKENMIFNSKFSGTTLCMPDNQEHCVIIDIRYELLNYKKQCITALEGLYSKFIIYNSEIGKDFFNTLSLCSHTLAHYDGSLFLKAQLGYMSSMYFKNDIDGKNVMHMARVKIVLEKILTGYSLQEALDVSDHRLELLNIKHSSISTFKPLSIELKEWAENAKSMYVPFFTSDFFKASAADKDMVENQLNNELVKVFSQVWNMDF